MELLKLCIIVNNNTTYAVSIETTVYKKDIRITAVIQIFGCAVSGYYILITIVSS